MFTCCCILRRMIPRKDLIEKAAKQGVRVYGLSEYCVKDNEDSTGKAVILLGYANMNEERIRAAVQSTL